MLGDSGKFPGNKNNYGNFGMNFSLRWKIPKFGQNSTYTCSVTADPATTTLEDFCTNRILNYALFDNFAGGNILIGRYGSSNINYISVGFFGLFGINWDLGLG